ncbi:MAG: hypothetical protein Q7S13_00695 [Candidatus Omnitrophota bacterium]|nr:hypothetical protein [Candidatus Omnitrophota bacterium]
MFKIIQNWAAFFRRRLLDPRCQGRSGQVAVVLILLIAMALIFYAVTTNLNKVVQSKDSSLIASNVAASLLASQMASYGQYQFETILGGNKKKCDSTNLLVYLIVIVIAAILIYFGQVWAVPLLLAAVAAAVIQITVVQPGITDAWNKQLEALSTRDQFLEGGIRQALLTGVTDQVQIEDLYDTDTDGRFGIGGDGNPLDQISRFGYYYSENRIKTINPVNSAEIQEFIDALKELVEVGNDNFCLYDPLPACQVEPADGGPHQCCHPQSIAQCNPCCLPSDQRPECCDTSLPEEDKCGDPSQCGAQGPYITITSPIYQPYVFDIFWEDDTDYYADPTAPEPDVAEVACFRELLGRDDEHDDYVKNMSSPNGTQTLSEGSGWLVEDTTGFYGDPYPPNDELTGIFKFFYEASYWGVELNALTTNDSNNPQCHWCDPRQLGGTTCDASKIYHNYNNPLTPEPNDADIPQLALPITPNPAAMTYQNTFCVDGTNANSGVDGQRPLASDKIGFPIDDVLAQPNACAQKALDPLYTGGGFWKPGADRFCTTEYPYYASDNLASACDKHKNSAGKLCQVDDGEGGTTTTTCDCEDAGDQTLWTEDILDDIIYGVPEFIVWAQGLVSQDMESLTEGFEDWYDQAAPWIESLDPNCYLCELGEDGKPVIGAAVIWRDEIALMKNSLADWRTTAASVGAQCDSGGAGKDKVWCVPPEGCEAADYIPAAEQTTFNVTGTRGDLDAVIQCLNYNVSAVSAIDASDGTNDYPGNYERYKHCFETCSRDACQDLPRSMLPLSVYDPRYFEINIPAMNAAYPELNNNEPDLVGMISCLADCTTCPAMAPSWVDSGGATHFYFDINGDGTPENPATATDFDTATDCPLSGSPWAPAVLNAIHSINAICDPSFLPWLSNTNKSMREAQMQTIKFSKRLKFLNEIKSRADGIIGILADAESAFSNFIAEANDLINYRKTLDDQTDKEKDAGLPYQAIYGWKDENKKGEDGLWHIVKVDARIPRRCDKACWPDQKQKSKEKPWPKVNTWTENWGSKRCYELIYTDGVVKARVSRWDETRASDTLYFPNKLPIWKFKSFTNVREGQGGPITTGANGLENTCAPQMLVGPKNNKKDYGAFLMNEPVLTGEVDFNNDPLPPNTNCWNRSVELLSQGVSTETCAEYFFSGNPTEGMHIRFVKCKEPF